MNFALGAGGMVILNASLVRNAAYGCRSNVVSSGINVPTRRERGILSAWLDISQGLLPPPGAWIGLCVLFIGHLC